MGDPLVHDKTHEAIFHLEKALAELADIQEYLESRKDQNKVTSAKRSIEGAIKDLGKVKGEYD